MSLYSFLMLITLLVVLCIFVKDRNKEIGVILEIAIITLLVFQSIRILSKIKGSILELSEYINIDSDYIVLLLKLLGIAYSAEISAEIARDSGFSATAMEVELLGKLAMIFISIPILSELINILISLLKGGHGV